MKVSKDVVNWLAPTRCRMSEKIDKFGNWGEIVDSATMIARESEAAKTASSLHCQAFKLSIRARCRVGLMPLCMSTKGEFCPDSRVGYEDS